MKGINLFFLLLSILLFSIKGHASVCEEKSDVIESFSYKSDYRKQNIKVCVRALKEDGYKVYILNDNNQISLNNLTKNLSASIQDISITPSEYGFSLVVNVGENYTKTITLKFNAKNIIVLEEILIYIPRSSKMLEEYKKISYQYDKTNFEDLEIEKILNDEF